MSPPPNIAKYECNGFFLMFVIAELQFSQNVNICSIALRDLFKFYSDLFVSGNICDLCISCETTFILFLCCLVKSDGYSWTSAAVVCALRVFFASASL